MFTFGGFSSVTTNAKGFCLYTYIIKVYILLETKKIMLYLQ